MIHLPRRKLYNRDLYLWIHHVQSPQSGMRLDRFLQLKYPRFSRSQIHKIIKQNRVRVDRKGEKLNQGLRPNSKVKDQNFSHTLVASESLPLGRASSSVWENDEVVILTYPKENNPVDHSIEIQAIYEDENYLVIDKPPFIAVHPSGGFIFNSLMV